jgi:hypothetical protein
MRRWSSTGDQDFDGMGWDGFAVIAQEGKPTLRRVWASRSTSHPAREAALRDLKTEHDEFAVHAWSAPGGVLGHHFEYQLTDLFAHRFSADRHTHAGDQLPISRKPARCQRTTVSGDTTINVFFQEDQQR